MNKTTNYDTKSSILSIDYKIPYDISESSRIVEHLQQSQEQLEFLKYKLSQTFAKVQKQIRYNMELAQVNDKLQAKVKDLQNMLSAERLENKKLKEVMQTMLKNRKMVQQQVQYTHKRYKKIIQDQEQQYQTQIQQLEKVVKRLRRQNQTLEDSLQKKEKFRQRSHRQSMSTSKVMQDRQRKLEHKIQILQQQIKKLTTEKVTQVTRLKHQIECYQRNVSPLRMSSCIQPKSITSRPVQIQYFDAESNNQNINLNVLHNHNNNMFSNKSHNMNSNHNMNSSTIVQSKLTIDSKADDDSISKWLKSKVTQLTDDQKLTRAQMQKKKMQSQLIKIERLKRHAPEDRQAITQLQKKIYELDSQISGLKRKIRQKY